MLLKPLEVIRIFDEFISPPGPKMVVCIEPTLGLFFRINSNPWQIPVKLELNRHPFLKHDSYLECGDPFILDDFIIEESIRESGIKGSVQPALAKDIFAAVTTAKTVSPDDKEAIRIALGC